MDRAIFGHISISRHTGVLHELTIILIRLSSSRFSALCAFDDSYYPIILLKSHAIILFAWRMLGIILSVHTELSCPGMRSDWSADCVDFALPFGTSRTDMVGPLYKPSRRSDCHDSVKGAGLIPKCQTAGAISRGPPFGMDCHAARERSPLTSTAT